MTGRRRRAAALKAWKTMRGAVWKARRSARLSKEAVEDWAAGSGFSVVGTRRLEPARGRRGVVTPSAGGVVLVPFPFSDLSQAKLRPSVVLGDAGRGDWILWQVTSNPYGDPRAFHLTPSGFGSGSLRSDSYARPGKLFTASRELMVAEVAVPRPEIREQLTDAVIKILRSVGGH
jgi:mRNA interferase MazF